MMQSRYDITGQKFNRLTVIKDSGKRTKSRSIIWECLCDCGKTTCVSTNNLKSGHVKSCGCLNDEKRRTTPRLTDLAGQRFGKILVLPDEGKRTSKGEVLWPYLCDCGRKGYRASSAIKKSKSCGCARRSNYSDLSGQRFGSLVVLEDSEERTAEQGVKWLCQCDCGTLTKVSTGNLKSGHTTSCGCIRSYGEHIIAQILRQNKISFEREWNGLENNYCYNPQTNGRLRFDFYLPDYNCCIEFDGIQHDKITGGWYDKEAVDKLQARDKIKEQYCLTNNIKLVRIKYKELSLINFDFLIKKVKGD